MGEGAKKELAMAGCGAIAKEHLKVLSKIDTIKLVALCDIDEKTVVRTAKEWNVNRWYTNFSEMLKNEDVSIVSILTPPQVHASMAIEAIKRGTNVLLEKPLTMTTGEAELILEALRDTPVKLTLNYNALLNDTMMKALAIIRESEIGQILGAEVRMLHTKNDPMASDERHWCHKLPGGRFGEMLAHPVYLLQSIIGDRMSIEKIFADKRGSYDWMRYDELYAMLHGNNGTGQIYVSFNAPRPAYLIDIYGTQRVLNIDLMNQTLIVLGSRRLSKTGSAMDNLNKSGELFFQTLQNASRYLFRESGQGALTRAYTSLLDSIEGRKQLVVTPEMAYNTVKVVEEMCKTI
jgi:predicted dehydrogenase